jgi:hypothetical protein
MPTPTRKIISTIIRSTVARTAIIIPIIKPAGGLLSD